MITLVNQTIYKCSHCRKTYQRKNAAEAHEVGCKKNPENHRACFGCAFITRKDIEFIEGYASQSLAGASYAERTVELSVCFCTKKNTIITPPNAYEIDEPCEKGTDNELRQEEMPKVCDLYLYEHANQIERIAHELRAATHLHYE